jgi:hypothetical protein
MITGKTEKGRGDVVFLSTEWLNEERVPLRIDYISYVGDVAFAK